LGSARNGAHNDQLPNTIDAREKLREKSVEGRPGRAAESAIRYGVTDAIGCRDAREAKLTEVPR
jgi:hypothetical protein